jgi:SH3-like domain-containing protein
LKIFRPSVSIALWPILATLFLPEIGLSQAPPSGSGLPLPRYVSLRAKEVNLRTGPGVRYPVDWVYRRRQLPVEVIAEFGTWRKVRDGQGTEGWVHQSLLSSQRTFTVTGQTRTVRNRADSKSAPVARAEIGVIGQLLQCPDGTGWCKVEVGGHVGWLRRVEFWGTYPRETVK